MAMKKKGYAKGGAMKKPVAMKKGSKVVKKRAGSKLKMVKKNGKSVPFFAADGVGKMKRGGAAKKRYGGSMKKKTMAKGGAVKKMYGGRMKKKTMAKGGKTRR